MMNEILFGLHILTILSAIFIALALGSQALTALICLLSILSNLFVTQQITLFGYDVVATDAFAVGAMLALNMMQEFFGRRAVTATIGTNFFVTLFYLAMSQFQLWYQPNSFDSMHHHFHALLTPMPRLIIASIFVYLIVQIIDSYIYNFLKTLLGKKYLTSRNVASLMMSQLLDTLLFSFLGLYGLVESVMHVIIISYLIKVIVIVCNAPFIRLAKYIGRLPN